MLRDICVLQTGDALLVNIFYFSMIVNMYLQFVPILICGEKSMSFILVDGGSGVLREI